MTLPGMKNDTQSMNIVLLPGETALIHPFRTITEHVSVVHNVLSVILIR